MTNITCFDKHFEIGQDRVGPQYTLIAFNRRELATGIFLQKMENYKITTKMLVIW